MYCSNTLKVINNTFLSQSVNTVEPPFTQDAALNDSHYTLNKNLKKYQIVQPATRKKENEKYFWEDIL